MRVKRRTNGERDAGLSEQEICRRLRREAPYAPEAEQIMGQAADCIERLADFRDSFQQIRMGLDLKIVQQGEELDRLKKIIDDYARICQASCDEIKMLRQRLAAK